MMNNNKILTVSYGTFSCTLEGFDDSFDTMKAIAEYFRDLASDDRYFGAEPPQPDADMLARIAEREVARRVEAREHDGHFMLKAHDDAPAAAPAQVAPLAASLATQPQPVEEMPSEPVHNYFAEPEAVEPEVAAAAPEVEAAEPEVEAVEPEAEFAEPEIEAVEAEIATPDVAEAPVYTPEEPVAEEVSLETSEETEAYTQDAYAVDDLAVDETVDEMAETDASVAEAEEFGADAADESVDADEVIAADDSDDAPFVEDVVSEEEADETEAAAASFFADSTFVNAADPEMEEEISAEVFSNFTSQDEPVEADDILIAEDVDAPVAEATTESFAEKLERIRAVVSQQDDTAIEADYEEDEVAEEPASSFDPLPPSFEAFSAEDDAEDTLAMAAEDINEALDQDDQTFAVDEAFETEADDLDSILSRIEARAEDETQEDADEDFDLVSEADEEHEPADNLFEEAEIEADDTEMHGRVLKVNRADFEAALETGELEEYEEEYEAEDHLNAPSLDADEEAELQQDLADLEEDHADTVDAPVAARESLPKLGEEASEDVSRLMAEADQQMNEPEAQTRRSAFAHLRAAVAARFADRSMDDAQKQVEKEAQVYRSDLAEVVKPRRPSSDAGARTERPTEAAAPLKLVAEQRIDTDEPADDRGPIAPRRVAASSEEDIDLAEDSGFAAYAQERGATSLTELLEAAAAYLAYVEGHDQFSRPQLMKRVRQADCGDFSREDGLRSFGQLLRNGKIEKIKGGRFAASEAIGYKPDHRAAG